MESVPMADGTSYERSGFTMSSIRPFALTISAAALVVMSACGSSTTTPSAAPSSSSTTSSPSAGGTAAAPTGPATVQISTTPLGKVLTDSRGFALYKFDPDDKTPGISTCYEVRNCATNWPPLLTLGAPVVGSGADDGKLGTTTRKDGTTQVTYNKLPLYFYAKDTAPGDVRGQAVGTIWWLVDADGKPVKTTSSPTSSPTTTS
jgi:predicted lipoprotein with Yx(FWY)xxD motif